MWPSQRFRIPIEQADIFTIVRSRFALMAGSIVELSSNTAELSSAKPSIQASSFVLPSHRYPILPLYVLIYLVDSWSVIIDK